MQVSGVTDPKIRQLAEVLVENHGDQALAVVTERVRMWLDVQDYPWVVVWAQVAEELHRMVLDAKPERPTQTLAR